MGDERGWDDWKSRVWKLSNCKDADVCTLCGDFWFFNVFAHDEQLLHELKDEHVLVDACDGSSLGLLGGVPSIILHELDLQSQLYIR